MCRSAAALVAILALFGCGDDIQLRDPPKSEEAEKTLGAGGQARGNPHARKGNPHAAPFAGNPHAKGGTEAPATHGKADGGVTKDPFLDPEDRKQKKAMAQRSAAPSIPPDHVWYSGRVTLDPSVKLPDRYTVFVSAGYPPKGRPPVLSRLYRKPKFPFDFELLQKNQAFGNAKMDTPLVLYLTLSESGSIPMGPPPPGFGVYWKSPLSAPHAPETTGLELLLKPRK